MTKIKTQTSIKTPRKSPSATGKMVKKMSSIKIPTILRHCNFILICRCAQIRRNRTVNSNFRQMWTESLNLSARYPSGKLAGSGMWPSNFWSEFLALKVAATSMKNEDTWCFSSVKSATVMFWVIVVRLYLLRNGSFCGLEVDILVTKLPK